MKYYVTYEQWFYTGPQEEGEWREGWSISMNQNDAEADIAWMSQSDVYRNVSEVLVPINQS